MAPPFDLRKVGQVGYDSGNSGYCNNGYESDAWPDSSSSYQMMSHPQ